MANELLVRGLSGTTVYAVIRNAAQQVANNVSDAFETYASGDYADYAIALTEQGASGVFVGSFPTWITVVGTYSVDYRRQIVGAPAESDPQITDLMAKPVIRWFGTSEMDMTLTLQQLLGLGGRFQTQRNSNFQGNLLLSYDMCLYDNAENATTNDGETGLLHKYTVTNSYNGGLCTESASIQES